MEEILEEGARFLWLVDTRLRFDLAGVAESECERGGRGTDPGRGWCRIGRCWSEPLEKGAGYGRWVIGVGGCEGPGRGGSEGVLAHAADESAGRLAGGEYARCAIGEIADRLVPGSLPVRRVLGRGRGVGEIGQLAGVVGKGEGWV
jgi:hypothetical protein